MVTKDNYFRIFLNYVFLVSLSFPLNTYKLSSLPPFQACGPTMVIASVYILFYYLKFRTFIGKTPSPSL